MSAQLVASLPSATAKDASNVDEEVAFSFLQMISNAQETEPNPSVEAPPKRTTSSKKPKAPKRERSPTPEVNDSSTYVNHLGRFRWKQALIDCMQDLNGKAIAPTELYKIVFARIPDICEQSGYAEQEVKRCIRHTIAEDVRDRADTTPFVKTGDGKGIMYSLTRDWRDRTSVSKDRPRQVERKKWSWQEKLIPLFEHSPSPMTVGEIAEAVKEKYRATELGKMDVKALGTMIKHFLKKYVQDETSLICRVSTGKYAARESATEEDNGASGDGAAEPERSFPKSPRSEDELDRPSSPVVREAVFRTFLEQNRPMKPREIFDCLESDDTLNGLTTRQVSSAIKKDMKRRGFESDFCRLPSGQFCLKSSLESFMVGGGAGGDGTPRSAEAPTLPPADDYLHPTKTRQGTDWSSTSTDHQEESEQVPSDNDLDPDFTQHHRGLGGRPRREQQNTTATTVTARSRTRGPQIAQPVVPLKPTSPPPPPPPSTSISDLEDSILPPKKRKRFLVECN